MIDGSFYQNGEIPGRDMSEIPHPFIVESMDLMRCYIAYQKSFDLQAFLMPQSQKGQFSAHF